MDCISNQGGELNMCQWFLSLMTSASLWLLHQQMIELTLLDGMTFLACALQTYKAGWNSPPNPSCSSQTGTVKISRHRGPRVQTPPISWLLPGHILGSPIYKTSPFSPVIYIIIYLFLRFLGWSQFFIPDEHRMACLISGSTLCVLNVSR